jgi:SagB-type dehydrogenase family enzyme
MGAKILWVLLPLVLYGLLLVLVWRGRVPSRLAVNMHGSLLLVVYLLSTAGLGIFWVANQQLPVFDWHYLFGYVTLLLVALHLFFNVPVLVRWLHAARPPHAARSRALLVGAAAMAALGAAFWVGVQVGDGGLTNRTARAPSLDPGAPDNATQAVVRFHEYSSESRTSVFQRAPVLALDAQPPAFKSYPNVRHIALERGSPADDGRGLDAMLRGPKAEPQLRAAPALPALTLAKLGQMLYLSAGVTARRGGIALRAAPSSGALFPVELYVVARRVDGLEAGLYHYDAKHHRLDALGALPASLAATLGEAEALIVLAAVFERTAWKYRNRAYRYVAADLGHLLENVRLAGHYAGVPVHLPVLFDEAPAAQALGLDRGKEDVLALAVLGEPPRAPAVADAPARLAGDAATVPVGEAARMARGDDAATLGGGDALLRLPRVEAAGGGDLYATVVARRSQRRFDAAPLALTELATLLAGMSQKPLLSHAVRIDLVVNRVAGVKPGVYRYLPDQHALHLVRAGELAQQAQSAALSQDVIGDAAVVLILSANRAAMFTQGARGYRMAFLEAGMMGQRWLLGATALKLAACPVGAFYDDEAAALIKADPQLRWVLHFAALGKPAR